MNESPTEGQSGLIDDPNISAAIKEDPLFRFLWKWRSQIGLVIIIVGAGWYFKYRMESTHTASMKAAAGAYAVLREDIDSVASLQKELVDLRKKVKEAGEEAEEADTTKIKELQGSLDTVERRYEGKLSALQDQKFPYNKIGSIYKTLDAAKAKNPNKLVSTIDSSSWRAINVGEEPAERFFSELEVLLAARALLDDSNAENKASDTLKDLATNGSFVGASAALTLAQIADSAEEQGEVRKIIESLQAAQPEQGGLLEEALARLK